VLSKINNHDIQRGRKNNNRAISKKVIELRREIFSRKDDRYSNRSY
jgi:hypothetical protein